MATASDPATISFARSRGRLVQLVILAPLLIAVLVFLLVRLLPIIPMLLTYRGTNAGLAKVLLLPALSFFTVFSIYIIWQLARSVRNAIVDRYLPLLTLDRNGLTLNGVATRTLVPWDEVTAIGIDRFRSARALRVTVRDPSKFPGRRAAKGIALDLQLLDGSVQAVVDAILSYPLYRGNRDTTAI